VPAVSEAAERDQSGRRQSLERAAHIAVLWAFAVAQPLFDLLGRNPEFFATRGSPSGDIVVFALVVTLVPPAILVGLEWLAGLAGERPRRVVHLVFVAALVAAIALQVIKLAATVPAFAIAVALGAAAAIAYSRLRPVRSFLSVLSPAPLVFLVLFLVVSDVSHLVFTKDVDVQAAGVTSRVPVVVAIFDEFPVHSLMDEHGRIDASLYPNFARLARGSTWYRNTASVDQDTPYAVPAIMDGRFPRKDHLPVAADHPQNIFTLLGGNYQLHVREDATAICPPSLCTDEDRGSFGERMESLWDDLSLVYAHLVLPDDLERDLPSVTETWGSFNEGAGTRDAVAVTAGTRRETKEHRYRRLHANLKQGRPGRWESFVSGIRGGLRPRLHLIHILMPHVPFQYLPSGRAYRTQPNEEISGLNSRPAYGVEFLVEQSYQRHLLQLQAADRLLGQLLDKLHRVGIYDRAVIAVVADHGISFRLGHDRRLVRRENVQEIAPVPFFLKRPGQRRGRISDKPLRTIDVLPTIADVLDIRIPWRIDGRSALAPTSRAQHQRRIVSKKFAHTYLVDTPSYESDKRAALERKVRLFGRGLYTFGPRPDLLGKRLADLPVSRSSGERAEIIGAGRYANVDPASGFIPSHVLGTIGDGRKGGGRTVAVAVNGKIEATGLTFTLEDSDDEQFSMLVPERTLRPGRNRVDVLLVNGGRLESIGRAG
jgi:Sulfatase